MDRPPGAGPVASVMHDSWCGQQFSLQPHVDRRADASGGLADLLRGRPLGGAAAAFGHEGQEPGTRR